MTDLMSVKHNTKLLTISFRESWEENFLITSENLHIRRRTTILLKRVQNFRKNLHRSVTLCNWKK